MRRVVKEAAAARAPSTTSEGKPAVALVTKIPAALALVAQQRLSGAICSTAAGSEDGFSAAAFMMDGQCGSGNNGGRRPTTERQKPCEKQCKPADGTERGGANDRNSVSPVPPRATPESNQREPSPFSASRLSPPRSSGGHESVSSLPGANKLELAPKPAARVLTLVELIDRQAPPKALCALVGKFSAETFSNWADVVSNVRRSTSEKTCLQSQSNPLGSSGEAVGNAISELNDSTRSNVALSAGGQITGPEGSQTPAPASFISPCAAANSTVTCGAPNVLISPTATAAQQLSHVAMLSSMFEAFLRSQPPRRLPLAEEVLRELSAATVECGNGKASDRAQLEGQLVCTSVATYFALFLLREGVLGANETGIKSEFQAHAATVPPCLDDFRHDDPACVPWESFVRSLLSSAPLEVSPQGHTILSLIVTVLRSSAAYTEELTANQYQSLLTMVRAALAKLLAVDGENTYLYQDYHVIQRFAVHALELERESALLGRFLVNPIRNLVLKALDTQLKLKSPSACKALEAALRKAQRQAEWAIAGRELLQKLRAIADDVSPPEADPAAKTKAENCIRAFRQTVLKHCFEEIAELLGRAAAAAQAKEATAAAASLKN